MSTIPSELYSQVQQIQKQILYKNKTMCAIDRSHRSVLCTIYILSLYICCALALVELELWECFMLSDPKKKHVLEQGQFCVLNSFGFRNK